MAMSDTMRDALAKAKELAAPAKRAFDTAGQRWSANYLTPHEVAAKAVKSVKTFDRTTREKNIAAQAKFAKWRDEEQFRQAKKAYTRSQKPIGTQALTQSLVFGQQRRMEKAQRKQDYYAKQSRWAGRHLSAILPTETSELTIVDGDDLLDASIMPRRRRGGLDMEGII